MHFAEETAFIKSQFNHQDFIPLHEPKFKGNGKRYVNEAIDSTFVSSVGSFVDRAELLIAEATKVQRAVAVSNGTAALQVALRLAGVKSNDEIITQALSFVATANAISYLGARPVFVDVDLDTMGLCPKALNNFLETNCVIEQGYCVNRKTGRIIRACVPMHTFGFMVQIDEILKVCTRWNIQLVEDAAEALGSSYKNQPAGSFGLLSAISFNGNKIITSGGGGAITTNSKELGEKAKYLTTTAKVPHPWDYVHDELGYNFRMPNLNAALLCGQIESLNSFIASKRELALNYKIYFEERGIFFRTEPENSISNYWLMSVQLESRKDRDLFLSETNNNGVMTRPIWKLLSDLPMYEDCQTDSLENSKFLEDRIVNIPSSARV